MLHILRIVLIAVSLMSFSGLSSAQENISAKKMLYEQTQKISQFPGMKSSDGTLLVFFDINCIYSYTLYKLLNEKSDYLKSNQIQTKWIPVNNAKSILSGDFDSIDDHFGKDEILDEASLKNLKIAKLLVGNQLKFPILAWENRGVLDGYIGTITKDDFTAFMQIIAKN